MKILIVKPTALGDVAQALLVVKKLREWKECQELVWVVDEDYVALTNHCQWVDRSIIFPRKKWKKKFSGWEMWDWAKKLRNERFDLVLDLQGLARSALMTLASGAPRRIGLKSSREGARFAYSELVDDRAVHAVERYRQGIDFVIGEEIEEEKGEKSEASLRAPNLDLPDGLKEKTYTVLHPYSQQERKLWPWQYYDILMKENLDETFVLVGMGPFFPVEAENCVDLRNQTSLELLMKILAESRVVISTDSGPIHIAAALGCRVIGIYGATSPEKTGPKGGDYRVISRWEAFGDGKKGEKRKKKDRDLEGALVMQQIKPHEVVDCWRKFAKIC